MMTPEENDLVVDLTGVQPADVIGGAKLKPKKRSRRHRDFYPTLPAVARVICKRVAEVMIASSAGDSENTPSPSLRVLEPTAGEGAFVRAAKETWPTARIAAVDIDGRVGGACLEAGAEKFLERDILAVDPAVFVSLDLVIGNLPFKDAARILRHIVPNAPNALVAILLPVGFFGASAEAGRDEAFRTRIAPIRYFAPLIPRPSFTGDGRTDRMEYGVFGFGRWPVGPRLDSAITWEK